MTCFDAHVQRVHDPSRGCAHYRCLPHLGRFGPSSSGGLTPPIPCAGTAPIPPCRYGPPHSQVPLAQLPAPMPGGLAHAPAPPAGPAFPPSADSAAPRGRPLRVSPPTTTTPGRRHAASAPPVPQGHFESARVPPPGRTQPPPSAGQAAPRVVDASSHAPAPGPGPMPRAHGQHLQVPHTRAGGGVTVSWLGQPDSAAARVVVVDAQPRASVGDLVLGILSGAGPKTLAQIGDDIKLVGGPTLRQRARAAGFETVALLVHSLPTVCVVGATAAGAALYSAGSRTRGTATGTTHPEGRRPVPRAVPVKQALPSGPASASGGPSRAGPGGAGATNVRALSGGALLRAISKAVRTPHDPLFSKEKLAGLGDSVAATLTPLDGNRTRRRALHLVVHLTPLFELLCAGKIPLAHGGRVGAFAQDVHLLATHCATPRPRRISSRDRSALVDAARPLAQALLNKVMAVAASARAASTSTLRRHRRRECGLRCIIMPESRWTLNSLLTNLKLNCGPFQVDVVLLLRATRAFACTV